MGLSPRIRSVAVQGGGIGAALVGGALSVAGLLWSEMKLAERRIPKATEPHPLSHDMLWVAPGVGRRRPPVRLAMMGDSLAVGYGVVHDRDTPGAVLASGISEAARRPVHVTNVAIVGAESSELPAQLERLGAVAPELTVIMIGANDVTAQVRRAAAVDHLEAVVRELVERGSEVVVGTCPDLGTVRPISQPLRAYARRLSRRMARDQTVAVVRAGGRTVSLGDLLGPLFASRAELFGADGFHPSVEGYAEAAAAILPSALDALGLPTKERSASTFTTRRAKPVRKAAAQAVARPGTEVAATEQRPVLELRREDGGPGAWARIRRRRLWPARRFWRRSPAAPAAQRVAVAPSES